MKVALAFCRAIDTFSNWVGEAVHWLSLPLVFVIAYEVVARYVFNRPTLWSWDIALQIFAFMTAWGAGYTLLHKGHVRSDVLATRLPPRAQLAVNIAVAPLFLFGVGVLAWFFRQEAWWSLAHKQVWESLFRPPIYPLKILIFAGFSLLLLQGLSLLIRDIVTLINPEADKRHE